MHSFGPYLHLNAARISARDGGVNTPIPVGFGLADVVFETPRNRTPALVDHPQHTVAISFIFDDQAKSINVRQARKGQLLGLHLTPNRVGFFGPALNFSRNSGAVHLVQEIAVDLIHHIASFILQLNKAADD